jgi:UDP-N-acetylmuramyl pentapeptide phosphotransferase/UDP-N-acetylglucosamine-1-phosphate transferase
VNFLDSAVLFLITGVTAWVATGFALHFLDKRAILDKPNERSSHRRPTPRGGGIALIPVIAAAWTAVGIICHASFAHWIVVAAGGALALVSWIDDVRGLPPGPRFLSHVVAVAIVLIALPANRLVFQGWLPLPLDRIAAGLLWVWFVNLFNFMDGIDGIAGVETISLGIGVAIVAVLGGGWSIAGAPIAPLGVALAAAAGGFLFWNWQPARIFMGDVGSVPIGFFSGWLLIAAAVNGGWAAALILPAYYLADATLTLVRRARRLEPIWRAHREHFYQKAVDAGWRHDRVSSIVAGLDLVLIGVALLSDRAPLAALVVAGSATIVVLLLFSRAERTDSTPDRTE